MFDITSSKLLLLAIVALIVIGPKDFPILLRTIGKYIGIIRGHAKEFRAQFDEMARDSELAQLKQDMEKIGKETEASISATGQSVERSLEEARLGVEGTLGPDPLLSDPFAHNVSHDANGLPPGSPPPAPADVSAANGAAPPGGTQPEPRPNPEPQPAADPPAPEPAVAAAPPPAHAPERTGA
jgi:sec-independent protein translocase protein TatB